MRFVDSEKKTQDDGVWIPILLKLNFIYQMITLANNRFCKHCIYFERAL